MTTYYVDPAATGANDGSSWTDAWTNVQSAFDTASTGGDIVYCRGTQTLTASIDIDTNAGDTTNGYIKFIGCNASGVVDGTKFVLDGNSAATYCLAGGGTSDYYWLENLELKNATSHGINDGGELDYSVYVNCIAHTNGGDGFYLSGIMPHIILCKGYSNTGMGINVLGYESRILYSVAYGNSSYGIETGLSAYGAVISGCIIHDNTTYGLRIRDANVLVVNTVVDGEATGIIMEDNIGLQLGNRITNNTNGIDCNNKLLTVGWNYFHNSTTADVVDATRAFNLPYRAALTNHLMSGGIDGTNKVDVDADDGYNDRANDDFNLKASRTLIRTEIDLEVGS